MSKLTKLYPPYSGEQPFLYFCFSDADAKRVCPLLERLLKRGLRIWYPVGRYATVADFEQRDARMGNARLVILYQTKRARADQTVKSAILGCQGKNIPIISIDTDDAESKLSMGLDSRTVHIKARGTDAQETALLHAEGISQELIGPSHRIRRSRAFGIAAVVLVAAFLLAGAALVYRSLRPPATAQRDDTVFFADPALTKAIRDALDGGPITEDSVQTITVLRLSALPENTDALLLLPNLSRIELDQSGADDALPLLDHYTVILTGGGE